jgi:hypothetical protein
LPIPVHWCLVTAHLYGEQMSIGVFAVTQACQEPGLQSITQQWGLFFAKPNNAVHWCCFNAHLYGEQMSKGVFAVTHGCCQPGLQNSTQQWDAFSSNQCCSALVLGDCTLVWRANVHGSICTDTRLLSVWFAEQHSAVGSAFCQFQCIGVW